MKLGNKQPKITPEVKIAIHGKQGAGKDLVFLLFKEQWPGIRKAYFSEAVKRIYCKLHDLPFCAIETIKNSSAEHRKGLQDLGQAGWQNIHPLFWVVQIDDNPPVGITDLRFKHEAKYLRDNGFFLIKVEADKEVRKQRRGGVLPYEDNISEIDLDEWQDWDYTIVNNGSVDDLKVGIKAIIQSIEERTFYARD